MQLHQKLVFLKRMQLER